MSSETAGSKISRVCELLISPTPDNLDRCTALLESAVAEVAQVGSRGEAMHLREAICRAGILLESAAEFHRHWSRTVNLLCAGYEAGGEAAVAGRPGRVSLAG